MFLRGLTGPIVLIDDNNVPKTFETFETLHFSLSHDKIRTNLKKNGLKCSLKERFQAEMAKKNFGTIN